MPADLVVGRDTEIDELVARTAEGISTLVSGPRRIGKTTVCDAVSRRFADEHDALIVKVDVPERIDADSGPLLRAIVDACAGRRRIQDLTADALAALRPAVEQWFRDRGIATDLSGLAHPARSTTTQILGLPGDIARDSGRRVLLFFDELQRIADYVDGLDVLTDVRDLYSGRTDVTILVDGSEQRTIEHLFEPRYGLGKLVSRYDLPTTIAAQLWQAPLTARFADADLALPDAARDQITGFGEGHPYATMAAARYIALTARSGASHRISGVEVDVGLDRARQHLRDDAVG